MTKVAKLKQDENKGIRLKTPQSIIHIKHKISLLQYKLWILLLHELKHQLDESVLPDEQGFRYVPMESIAEKLGYLPKKTEIWNDLLALKNETIAFNLLGKDGQKAKYGAGFISEWTVTSQRVGFKFPSILEEVMRGLDDAMSIFQLLNWDIFNHFSGKYEAIIYKLCKDYVGVERTPKMTVSDFREYMGLVDGEYGEFKELNRWTISTPIKNINKSPVSDISVDVSFSKNGRKVEALYFVVKPRYEEFSILPALTAEHDTAFALAKITFSSSDKLMYLKSYSQEIIYAAIERANQYGIELEIKGKKVNYGAIYKKAIYENWGQPILDQKKLIEDSQILVDKSKSQTLKKSQPEDLKYIGLTDKQIINKFKLLDDVEKARLRDLYIFGESVAFRKIWNDALSRQEQPEDLAVFNKTFIKFLHTAIV